MQTGVCALTRSYLLALCPTSVTGPVFASYNTLRGVEGILDVVMSDLLVIDNDGSIVVHWVVRLQIILWLSELYGKES